MRAEPTARGERSRSLLVLGAVHGGAGDRVDHPVVNLRNRPVETAGGQAPAVGEQCGSAADAVDHPGEPRRRQPSPTASSTARAQLGAAAFCAATPECWAGVISWSPTSPRWRPPRAARSGTSIRPSPPASSATTSGGSPSSKPIGKVRRVCTVDVVNSMLRKQDRRSDWEVMVIGPQLTDDTFYRCIFGRRAALLQGAHVAESRPDRISALGQPLDPVQQPRRAAGRSPSRRGRRSRRPPASRPSPGSGPGSK